MVIFLILGVLFLVFAFMFFFAPHLIVKLSEIGNKLIFTDHATFTHRKLSGFILLITSVLMFYLGLRMW